MLGEPGLYFCTFGKTWDVALEFFSELSREHHQVVLYSTSGLSYNSKTLCTTSVEMNRCAAKELCICKAAGAPDGRHACPACQCNVHAICDELCKDTDLLSHTLFSMFQHHVSIIAAADR
jgi:hypothetical protein